MAMQFGLRFSTATVALIGASIFWAPSTKAQSSQDLVRQLESPATTNAATRRLLKIADSDHQVRLQLETALPTIIEPGPKSNSRQVWRNAVRLAGELKISQAAPALTKWIGLTRGAWETMGSEENLYLSETGRQLVQIGEPAVPALREGLRNSDTSVRFRVINALFLIDSPDAKDALRGHLAQESDPQLADYLKKRLAENK